MITFCREVFTNHRSCISILNGICNLCGKTLWFYCHQSKHCPPRHRFFSTSDVIMTSPPQLLSVTKYFSLQLPTSILVYGRLHSLIFHDHVTKTSQPVTPPPPPPPNITMMQCVEKKLRRSSTVMLKNIEQTHTQSKTL